MITHIANSNSTEVKPTRKDCELLKKTILEYKPKVAIILHSKVLKHFVSEYLGKKKYASNSGAMGRLLSNCDTMFYNIAFPHGNAIPDEEKIKRYKEVKELILTQ